VTVRVGAIVRVGDCEPLDVAERVGEMLTLELTLPERTVEPLGEDEERVAGGRYAS
jgi:hypothetical protein